MDPRINSGLLKNHLCQWRLDLANNHHLLLLALSVTIIRYASRKSCKVQGKKGPKRTSNLPIIRRHADINRKTRVNIP